MDFHGVKVAILVDNKILVHLRDDKPGLFNASMWDFPGGGREGSESPTECLIREVNEELELTLEESDIIWQKIYPAQKDPDQSAYFFVARVDGSRVENLTLHEGQKWTLMEPNEFLSRSDVVEALKVRFQDFLKLQKF